MGGVEAEADVVGGPGICGGVVEDGFQEGDCGLQGLFAVRGREVVEDAVAEGVEPETHAVGAAGSGVGRGIRSI